MIINKHEPMVPLVCIVVLNYEGRDHLGYCLPSLAQTTYSNFNLLVVDNASTDDSPGMVAELCPQAQLLMSDTNRGWSGGNNLAICTALQMGARYIVLANNDIRVDPRWVQMAVQVAEQDEGLGVIGFDIFEPQPDSEDRDAGFEQASAIWKELQISYPKYVGGMAMFVRAELFERIGLFDEGFFAYGEENDFQIRARKAGYKVVAVNVPVWHHGQASFSKIPMRAARLQTRNNIQLLIKHSSLKQIIHSGLRHVRERCLPARSEPTLSPVERRLRSSNFIIRLGLLLDGFFWNLLHLPNTLRRRREDNQRVELARRLFNG